MQLFEQPQILFVDGWPLPVLGAGSYYGMVLPPPGVRAEAPSDPTSHGAPVTLEQAKRLHVKTVLDALDWHMSEAGRVLDVDRRTLYRLCKRWGLVRPVRP